MLRVRIGGPDEEDTEPEVMLEDAADTAPAHASASDCIEQRLLQYGVPEELLKKKQEGFVQYVKEHPDELRVLVTTLLPGTAEVQASSPSGSDDAPVGAARNAIQNQCRETLSWLQWCAFGRDPQIALEDIRQQLGGSRGVCGAVWGKNDIAYRCHTCEHDPTCAICVPCFQAGDHSSHDYSMMRTNGGCCDCGDATAWKESGFCSRHRGPGQVPPLPTALACSMRPVLEALLLEWKDRLLAALKVALGKPRKWSSMTPEEKIASQLSLCVTHMLLEFCNCSENMLSFAAEIVSNKEIGLLDTLMTTECFLPKHVDSKLHELLYKLLGDPNFKYRFAQAFIGRYPKFLHDSMFDEPAGGTRQRDQSILGNFSVQIFTVPTLTPRLVLESRLLDMLFGILKEFFLSCVGDGGRFMVSKPSIQDRVYYPAVEDVRYVMSHLKVAQYIIHEFPQMCRTWLQFLAFIQGMYPQKRITSIHIEEENEDWVSAFLLEAQMANIHPLFVAGTSLVGRDSGGEGTTDLSGNGTDNEWGYFSRSSLEKDATPPLGREQGDSEAFTVLEGVPLSKALIWLISECVTVMDAWFAVDASRESAKAGRPSTDAAQGPTQRRRMHLRGRLARAITGDRHAASTDEVGISSSEVEAGITRGGTVREWLRRRRSTTTPTQQSQEAVTFRATEPSQDTIDMDVDVLSPDTSDTGGNEWWMGSDETYGTGLSLLAGEDDWPVFEFDVSKQEVSFHIPLHRMLALLLHKALEEYETKFNRADVATSSSDNEISHSSFLLQLFPEPFQVTGFAALMMEHPLRLQVLCAQVQAGMWRRNGHTIIGLCDIYRSVQWCEDSLELDLFMLQCCAAMAPAEEFVGRVLSCFGLGDYFSLFLWRPNEYEPFLAQELLVLLIRIISERGFCGLSAKESLKRELIQRLAIGDAAHSSLLNALPPRLHDSKHLQETLENVATYRRPHGMQQGKYVLREQSWRELDLYHPRWTPRELQSAEERYLRVCKASALFSQAPKWRKPFLPLQSLSNLAVSAKVHDILRAVFFHAAFSPNLSESRSPESLLFTALHLLALGLDVCSAYPSRECNREKLMECHPFSSFEPSSPPSKERPPLLSHVTEYVHVGGADGTQLPDRQSTLSLLVLLMRKYVASEGAQLVVSETSPCNVGSFIKNLLHRFAELDRQCMYAIESLAPEILHRLSADSSDKAESASSKGSELQAEISDIERKRALARERQAAMMAKMRAAQDKFMASVETSEQNDSRKNRLDISKTEGKRPRETLPDEDLNAETASPLCALCRDRSSTSPLCILTLVQRSRLLALDQKPVPSWDKLSKKVDETSAFEKDSANVQNLVRREAENLISELRQWLEGAVGDPNVDRLTNRDDFFELLRGELPSILNTDRFAASPSGRALEASHSESDVSLDDAENIQDADLSLPVDSSWWEQNALVAVRDGNENNHAIITVLAEYVAAVSRTQSETQPQAETEMPRDNASRVRRLARSSIESKVYNSIGLNDFIGLHLSACGHAAHQECVDRYYSSLLQRYYSRSLFEGVQIVDPDLGEFLCPVCRRLSNSILPVIDGVTRSGRSSSVVTEAVDGFKLEQACCLLYNAEELMCKPGFRKAVSKKLPDTIKGVLDSIATRLCGLFYPEKDHLSSLVDGRNYQGLFLWDVLRYSIMAAELAARTKNLIVGLQDPANRLVVLEEAAEASRGSVLPLLFVAAKSALTQSRQAVLLRARGMQLMVGSICHGFSRDLLSEKSSKGHLHSLLHYLEKGQDSADVQFWKRTADPILVHDPFSSLIWLLFALPLPVPSYQGPFTALVHLFYLVCLVQCIGSVGRTLAVDAAFPPQVQNFVAAVHASLIGTCISFQSSEDAGSSGAPLEDIRRFTLPYLRRCALLQTVCSATASSVPIAGSHSWDLSNVHSLLSGSAYREASDKNSRQGETEAFELKEVEELEKRFHIPALQTILAEEAVKNLVMKWCQHLHDETGSRYFPSVPRPVRATAFQLMRLPHLFQELLQRFVKERCPRCDTVPERPALCLLCGALCCASGSSGCCSVNLQSECYRHAITCGGGVGVYLMLRKTNVLLVRRERQAMWPSPYLDAFGEEDQDMRRGKPLFLSEERYAALTAMVASHGLDYSSSVLSHTTRDTMF